MGIWTAEEGESGAALDADQAYADQINDGMPLRIAGEWKPCRKRNRRTRSAPKTAFPIPCGSRPGSVEQHKKNAITVIRSRD